MLEGVQHGVMFRAAADQVSPAGSLAARQAEDGEIVRFRAAARKN